MGIIDEHETPSPEIKSAAVRSKTGYKVLLNLAAMLLILGITVFGTFYIIRNKPELIGLTKTTEDNQKEAEDLVKKISKIISLPEGEAPTVATVNDLPKISNQEFFKNAKEGDKVLVYVAAKKAYLYRPSENRIIEVGVVNANQAPEKNPEEVAGDSTEIPVITLTPIPTRENNVSPTPQPTVTKTTERNTTSPTPIIEE